MAHQAENGLTHFPIDNFPIDKVPAFAMTNSPVYGVVQDPYTEGSAGLNVPYDIDTNTAHTNVFDFTEDLFFEMSGSDLTVWLINGATGTVVDGVSLSEFELAPVTLEPYLFGEQLDSEDTLVIQSTSGDLFAVGNFELSGSTVTFDFIAFA